MRILEFIWVDHGLRFQHRTPSHHALVRIQRIHLEVPEFRHINSRQSPSHVRFTPAGLDTASDSRDVVFLPRDTIAQIHQGVRVIHLAIWERRLGQTKLCWAAQHETALQRNDIDHCEEQRALLMFDLGCNQLWEQFAQSLNDNLIVSCFNNGKSNVPLKRFRLETKGLFERERSKQSAKNLLVAQSLHDIHTF